MVLSLWGKGGLWAEESWRGGRDLNFVFACAGPSSVQGKPDRGAIPGRGGRPGFIASNIIQIINNTITNRILAIIVVIIDIFTIIVTTIVIVAQPHRHAHHHHHRRHMHIGHHHHNCHHHYEHKAIIISISKKRIHLN